MRDFLQFALPSIFALIIVIVGQISNRRKLKADTKKATAETESILIKQYKEYAEDLRSQQRENRERIQQLEAETEECNLRHAVAMLEIGDLRRAIKTSTVPRELIFVLDDNPIVTKVFQKAFSDISTVECRTFVHTEEFLNKVKLHEPHILILDYHLEDGLTAENVLELLDYEPEVFIMSHDKNLQMKIKDMGMKFFPKGDFYELRIAKEVVSHLKHKHQNPLR